MDGTPSWLPEPGSPFWQEVARFAFVEFLRCGAGYCILMEPKSPKGTDAELLAETLGYMPEGDGAGLPPDVAPMVAAHDPAQEVVLVCKSGTRRDIVRRMGSDWLGGTPVDLFRAWSAREGHGRFIPGEPLVLAEAAGDVPPGLYMYVGRRGAWLELAETPLDSDGTVSMRKAIRKAHCDYESCFKTLDPELRKYFDAVAKDCAREELRSRKRRRGSPGKGH